MREDSLSTPSDSIEFGEVARVLRRGWRSVALLTVLGAAAGGAVLLVVPKEYKGRASVLVRASSSEGGSSLLSKMTGLGDLGSGSDLIGGLKSQVETEIQVLKSRALIGPVVDSLRLQFSVRSPSGYPAAKLVSQGDLLRAFAPRRYRFTRLANGSYQVTGSDSTREMRPGAPTKLEIGNVTFVAADLPESFSLKVYDREDAIKRFEKRLATKKAGGDVAEISYDAPDSRTAAEATNALVASYLELRKTVDRGTNARRVEFLTEQLDSIGKSLTATERALRQQQEASGVLDPTVMGRVELEGASLMRKALVEVETQEGAINVLLDQVAAGKSTPGMLAAHPAFLLSPSLTPFVTQIAELHTARINLLERRTPTDPEVKALDQSISMMEQQLLGNAKSFSSALARQRAEISSQLDTLRATLLSLPAAAEGGLRLQRDVVRLSGIYAGVQAQLVSAKLAAIGEGGLVRQLDIAEPPRKPTFPKPLLTMALGIVGGFFCGLVAALLVSGFGGWLRDPREIERATGLPVQLLTARAPLLISGADSPKTVLVVPLGRLAPTKKVVERITRTARYRALRVTSLDLSAAAFNGNGAGPESTAVGASIDQLEQQHGMVVVELPELANDTTLAALRSDRPVVLVAPPGRVNRQRLEAAVQALRRMQIPVAGIVTSEAVSSVDSE